MVLFSYFAAVLVEAFIFDLENPDATKAKLISRMAKMGQPMLPFLTGGANQPESSDSELEVGPQAFTLSDTSQLWLLFVYHETIELVSHPSGVSVQEVTLTAFLWLTDEPFPHTVCS